jgi:hypothetical protein
MQLGMLCDIVAFALPLHVDVKQQLLEERRVERRVRTLLRQLKTISPPQAPVPVERRFPPEFSVN